MRGGAPWLDQCRRGMVAEIRCLQPAISDIDEQPGHRYKKGNSHVDQGAVAFEIDIWLAELTSYDMKQTLPTRIERNAMGLGPGFSEVDLMLRCSLQRTRCVLLG